MKLDNRQLGTVLAALRYWQRTGSMRQPEYEVSTNGGDFEPLSVGEIDALIDALCEQINGEAPLGLIVVTVEGGMVSDVVAADPRLFAIPVVLVNYDMEDDENPTIVKDGDGLEETAVLSVSEITAAKINIDELLAIAEGLT